MDVVQDWWSLHPLVKLVCIVLLGVVTFILVKPADTRRPPLVSYWIPWLGSAISLGKNPDEFFKRASETLGPVFRVVTAGKEITYITSPSLINAVYRDSKVFEFHHIRLDMSSKIFSVPDDVNFSQATTADYFPEHHRVLSPKNVPHFLDRYVEDAYEQVLHAITKIDGNSTPLISFLIPPAFSAAATAFFGKTFPAEKAFPGFTKFNNKFHLLVAGLPRFIVSDAFRAWDSVIDLVRIHVDQIKDSDNAPPLIEMTVGVFRRVGWDEKALGPILAADLWALEANAIWAAYWVIVLVLRTPEGLKPLYSEVDAARMRWKKSHPGISLDATSWPQFMKDSADQLPLIASSIQEALRFCTSSFSMRIVSEPTEFAGYQFQPGDQVVCATRNVHLDEEIHENATSFVIDRYVDGQKRLTKDGKVVPNHTMPFGGGVSMCEGRHFALGEIKAFLTLLLTYASIEAAPGTAWPELHKDKIGVGILDAVGDVTVIVNRRNH